MNYTSLFYWLTVADNSKSLFSWATGLSVVGVIVSIIFWILSAAEDDPLMGKTSRRWLATFLTSILVFSLLNVFTPTRKDSLLIVAGGETMNFLTTDSSTRKLPAELTNFVVSELHSMASEAKVNIDINTQKEKILQEAKSMKPSDLIDKMKSDTSFAKIILNP